MGADFAGFPLKEAVVAHLKDHGWKVTDIGVKKDSNPEDTDLMFHRIGLRVGAMIAEKEFERALIFVEREWEFILQLVNVRECIPVL